MFESIENNVNVIRYKIGLKDKKLPIIFINDKIRTILGYKKKKIIKNKEGFLFLLAEEDKNALLSYVDKKYSKNTQLSFNLRLLDKKKRKIWFKNECEILVDDNKNAEFMQGILININSIKTEREDLYLTQKELKQRITEHTTDLILTNKALLKQNRFIKSIIESIAYPFFVINPNNGEIVMANSYAYDRKIKYGYKCYETLSKFDEPCWEKDIFCPITKVMKNKKSVKIERNIDDKIMEIHFHPVINNQREIINIIMYLVDITEPKKSHNKLIESEEKFRTIFEESSTGLLIYSALGDLIQINKSAINLLEIKDISEFYAVNVFNTDFIPAVNKKKILNGRMLKFEKKISINSILNSENNDISKEKEFEITITPLTFNTREGIKFIIMHLRDISKDKEIEMSLRMSKYAAEEENRLKSDFLANISHDLRTPLNAIINFSRALGKGVVGDLNHEQRDLSERVLNSGKMLLQLINDLLDISKIESGNMDIIPAKIFLPDLEKTIKDASLPYQKPDVILNIKVEQTFFYTDENKLEQIIYNLVSNAFKYTYTGSVDVNLSVRDGVLTISVRDTGIGIKRSDINKIFDKYFQSSKVKNIKSTGLGLAIVKELAIILNGEVQVESEKDSGSEFIVILNKLDMNLDNDIDIKNQRKLLGINK